MKGRRRLRKRQIPMDIDRQITDAAMQAGEKMVKDKLGQWGWVGGIPPKIKPKPWSKTNVKRPKSGTAAPAARRSVVVGKRGPDFPKTRKNKKNPFAKFGVQLQYEYRGTINDPNCIYIGYGTPVKRVFESAIYCILKRLFLDAGIAIENYDEVVPIPSSSGTAAWTVYFNYYPTINSTAQSSFFATIDYSAGKKTYSNFVTQIVAAFDTTFSSAIPCVLHCVDLYQGVIATPSGNSVARVYLDTATINFRYKAFLESQNATVAPNGTADTKYNTDRIDVNPLRGKKYSVLNTNCMIPRLRDETTTPAGIGYLPFLADQETGLYSATATNEAGTFATLATVMGSGFYKAPEASSFQKARGVGIHLEPGEIKKDSQYFAWRGSMQRLFELIYDQIVDFATTKYVKFGRFTTFAWEHMNQQSADVNVQVDYEGNYEVAAAMKFRKPPSVPVVRVQ